MNGSDLRLGNWIMNGTIKTVVHGITNDNAYIDPDGDIYPLSDCTPIFLTEEWIIKFGFNKDGFKESFKSGHSAIIAGSSNLVLTHPKVIGEWQEYFIWEFDRFKFVPLRYVHQLQNLNFTLCGKELTIKKPMITTT